MIRFCLEERTQSKDMFIRMNNLAAVKSYQTVSWTMAVDRSDQMKKVSQ